MKKRMPFEKNTRQSNQLQRTKYHPKLATRSRKPLAPFSHTLAVKRQQWREVNVHLFANQDRWKRAEQRNSFVGPACGLVLPENAKPQQFRWPVLGCQIFVAMGENHNRWDAVEIARVLHLDGADLIVVSYGPRNGLTLFARDELRRCR